MPLYEYECSQCKSITEEIRTVDKCHDAPPCKDCEGDTHKVISSGIRTAVRGFKKGMKVSDSW